MMRAFRTALTTSLVSVAVLVVGIVGESSAQNQGKRPLPKFPGADSPIRKTAEKYNFSMNMLLFPDYFMSDEEFTKLRDNGFRDSNLPNVVRGLRGYGFKVEMPQSAGEYREKIYPAMLDFLKKAGYTAIEVPINGAKMSMCPALRKALEERGLRITAVGGCDADLEKSLKHRIDCAHALGANLFAGPIVLPFKQFPEDKFGNDRVAWVNRELKKRIEPMRRMAAYAQKKGVKLAVEPLNRFELPGLNRLADAIRFVEQVDHPNFGVMIDTCHEMSEGAGAWFFARQVAALAKNNRLFHVHISAIHRGRIDRSWIQWWGFFTPILKSGYKGNMSMEIFDAAEPFASAVNINRRQFQNPMEVALSALIFSAQRLQSVEKRIAE